MEEKADFFISHASEDKEDFVRELAELLLNNGANVFYDEYSIKLGDSLTDSINKGLQTTNNAILVLSKYFFDKSWTQAELQAIFHKARTTGYKILIIYHNITNEQVTERYPLLSDIKAIDSKVGLEAIINALFNAINKRPSLRYIYSDLKGKKSTSAKKGLYIAIRFGFPRLGDKRIEKTIFEIGTPNIFNNRVKINLIRNKRLYFEITDTNFRKLGLSIDISDWKLGEQYLFIGSIDTENNTAFLMLDGIIKDEIRFGSLDLQDDFMENGRHIFGCSLELENPSPFIISFQAIGQFMTIEECILFNNSVNQFLIGIGRK